MARYPIALILAIGLTVVSGCRKSSVAELDERERHDPAVQAAWAAAEAGDIPGAESKYEAIILDNPDHARAHLDLAMVLMNAEEKPVKAIYHFMRYQELRPDSEKDELIGRNIRQLTVLIGNKVARSRMGQLEQRMALLQAENEGLRRGNAYTPVMPAVLSPVPAVTSAPPAVRGPFVPRGPRLYTVQPGDSLSRIAQLMYGDGERSEKIYEANRGKLRSRNSLQAGQVLVIPP
jgi:nucleoid-associated protein YgaU